MTFKPGDTVWYEPPSGQGEVLFAAIVDKVVKSNVTLKISNQYWHWRRLEERELDLVTHVGLLTKRAEVGLEVDKRVGGVK